MIGMVSLFARRGRLTEAAKCKRKTSAPQGSQKTLPKFISERLPLANQNAGFSIRAFDS